MTSVRLEFDVSLRERVDECAVFREFRWYHGAFIVLYILWICGTFFITMSLINRYLKKTEFGSYSDFIENYELSYPDNFNYATDIVDEYAKINANRRALIWCDDHGARREYTFGDISTLSKQTATYLVSLGIKKGDMVMIVLKRSVEFWLTSLALHRIGAITIPISYLLTAKDIVYRANSASVKMIIAADDDYVIEQVELARKDCPTVSLYALLGDREGWLNYSNGIAQSKPDFVADKSITVKDMMLMYFTSGTTGFPKMVMHDYSYPLGHITTAKYWQQVNDNCIHLTMADSGWAKFAWGQFYGQWIAGGVLLGYAPDNKFSAAKLIEIIRTFKPVSFCVPGTVYRMMMKEGITREEFSSVKHCCTAGEPLAPEISTSFREITGISIHEGFGQSETSVLIGNFDWFEPHFGSAGKFSPLYDFDIIDVEGESCRAGTTGELVVKHLDEFKPAGLLAGYWNGKGLVPAYDKNYIYHTGDLVWKDEDGYIWFVGRNDDMIKCSGYRIGPFEIESVLMTHPAVDECAITGAPDPIRGQVVKATVVLNKGYTASPELTLELQTFVKHLTAPYKYPRIIEYVDSLPKTTSGKIQRSAIRQNLNKATE